MEEGRLSALAVLPTSTASSSYDICSILLLREKRLVFQQKRASWGSRIKHWVQCHVTDVQRCLDTPCKGQRSLQPERVSHSIRVANGDTLYRAMMRWARSPKALRATGKSELHLEQL